VLRVLCVCWPPYLAEAHNDQLNRKSEHIITPSMHQCQALPRWAPRPAASCRVLSLRAPPRPRGRSRCTPRRSTAVTRCPQRGGQPAWLPALAQRRARRRRTYPPCSWTAASATSACRCADLLRETCRIVLFTHQRHQGAARPTSHFTHSGALRLHIVFFGGTLVGGATWERQSCCWSGWQCLLQRVAH